MGEGSRVAVGTQASWITDATHPEHWMSTTRNTLPTASGASLATLLQLPRKQGFLFAFFFYYYYLFVLREHASRREAKKESKRENPKAGSMLSAKSPTWGSNSWTVRSWPEWRSRVWCSSYWATQVRHGCLFESIAPSWYTWLVEQVCGISVSATTRLLKWVVQMVGMQNKKTIYVCINKCPLKVNWVRSDGNVFKKKHLAGSWQYGHCGRRFFFYLKTERGFVVLLLWRM